MQVFYLKDLDSYELFVEALCSSDQPVFVYSSENHENHVLVSTKEVDNDEIEEKIELFIQNKKKSKTDLVDDNEPLFDYEEEEGLL